MKNLRQIRKGYARRMAQLEAELDLCFSLCPLQGVTQQVARVTQEVVTAKAQAKAVAASKGYRKL